MTITDFFPSTDILQQFVRGIDGSTIIDQFAPLYRQASKKLVNIIGLPTYNKLKNHIATPPAETDEKLNSAVEYTRAVLANWLAVPWFILDSQQRNATDKKLYRYQEDQTLELYLENAWAELDLLIELFESDTTKFSEFAETLTSAERAKFYLRTAATFDKYFGIDNSSYFYYRVIGIMKEVQEEEIFSRIKDEKYQPDFEPEEEEEEEENDKIPWLIRKAIAFETVARAAQRFDYSELPKGLRSDIGKEISASGNKSELGSIKDAIYTRLHSKAIEYLEKIETALTIAATTDSIPVIPTEVNSINKKFYLST